MGVGPRNREAGLCGCCICEWRAQCHGKQERGHGFEMVSRAVRNGLVLEDRQQDQEKTRTGRSFEGVHIRQPHSTVQKENRGMELTRCGWKTVPLVSTRESRVMARGGPSLAWVCGAPLIQGALHGDQSQV